MTRRDFPSLHALASGPVIIPSPIALLNRYTCALACIPARIFRCMMKSIAVSRFYQTWDLGMRECPMAPACLRHRLNELDGIFHIEIR